MLVDVFYGPYCADPPRLGADRDRDLEWDVDLSQFERLARASIVPISRGCVLSLDEELTSPVVPERLSEARRCRGLGARQP